MKRVMLAMVVGLAVGFLARRLVGGGESGAERSAAEIVARNVEARGGLDAWRRVATMVWTGRIESAHAPAPSMPFVLQQARPNRSRLEIEALGERAVRVFDGARGWRLSPGRGPREARPFTAQELEYEEAGSGIDGPLIDYAAKGSAVALVGVEALDGRQAWHLQVRPAKGGQEDVWIDAETGLDVRYDRMADGPGGGRRVSVTYGDYRTVEGLKIPFLISTGGGPGVVPDKMQIETVVLNAALDASTFGDPGAPGERAVPRVASRAPAPLTLRPRRGTAPP